MAETAHIDGVIEPPAPSLVKCLVAELLGTFFLTLTALFAPPEILVISIGVVVLAVVIAIANVSGGHINPAVTIGAIAVGAIPVGKGIAYMVAQTAGAFLAVILQQAVVGGAWPATNPPMPGHAFIFELLGDLFFLFIIIRVVISGLDIAAIGLAIGGAIMIAVAIAAGHSGGILNPAIGLALLVGNIQAGSPANFLAYIIAPLLGGVIGGLLGKFLAPSE